MAHLEIGIDDESRHRTALQDCIEHGPTAALIDLPVSDTGKKDFLGTILWHD
jgi:hypothetical protein